MSCTSCGADLGPTAKFCSECGAPLATATQPAEYKQVTVLFADVVHSMDIAAAVGPERLREIMAELVVSPQQLCGATAAPSTVSPATELWLFSVRR